MSNDNKPDIADIIAGALQTSRAHAYELMRAAALAEKPAAAAERGAVNVVSLAREVGAKVQTYFGGATDITISALQLEDFAERLATPPAQAAEPAQVDVEALYREVGRKMVEITTTVRSPKEWLCIPELWLECLRERDSLKAAATK